MALMVLVNTPGTGEYVYAELHHREWHGWTLADVVFPSFVWIVGVAITLSLGKRLAAGEAKSHLVKQILRRGAIIFALGLLVYAFPKFDPATFRILGVLQRIAICYVFASVIYLYMGVRGQMFAAAWFLLSYWGIMLFGQVPEFGSGHLDVERNFAHYIDRIVLGAHNYEHTKTWDPEGIVSTLPAIASALLGVLAGHVLGQKEELVVRLRQMVLIGAGLLIAAVIWDRWLPINKSLWTSSFALFMAGLDFALLALFAWLIDGLGFRKWARPFVILGMNAIAVYMASELIDITLNAIHLESGVSARVWLYQTFFAGLASPHVSSLLYAISYTLLMFALAWILYRKGWFLRV